MTELSARRPGRVAMRTAVALAALYVVDVVIAAWAQKTKTVLPFRVGERGEALVFLAASVAFVVALLLREPRSSGERRSVWRVIDDNAERYAMLVFYVFVCAVIVQEVMRRFLLNFSSAWAEESARYAFIYLGYVGAAYAIRERAHIRFDIVYLFSELATLVFAAFALYWSLKTVGQLIRFEGESPVLRVNKAWFVAALPIGFALIVLRALQAMKRDIADLRAGNPVHTGKAMFEE